jgi:hypothetical protein
VFLEPVNAVRNVKPHVERAIGAPMIELSRYTLANGEKTRLTIFSGEDINIMISAPDGATSSLKSETESKNVYSAEFTPEAGVGMYAMTVKNRSGKQSEATVYSRHPWSWYMKQARKEAIRIPQKATTHTESWLGHYSTYLARRYFPDSALDKAAEHNFRTILPLMWDVQKAVPLLRVQRIQNNYYMIGLLVDIYRATNNIDDLLMASKLADWLIKHHQDASGAYRFRKRGGHYTSVAYGGKSMLELAAAEKELRAKDPVWGERYKRHYASAKAAIDDLARRLDDIGTEGQPTYEDGMIGCSATQLAMFALLQEKQEDRAKYLEAARYMFGGHRCLNQMIVPDCRMNEGSLRFWEAQYDVMIRRNMMNSPHGWSAWRIPGLYYMYQLTGDEAWLRRAMNALGSCVQLIDGESGRLRWAFVQDPFIKTKVLAEDPNTPLSPKGKYSERVIGEQYVEMISHFFRPSLNKVTGGHWGEGGSCDNDVHEVFKALEEVALTSAYVVERESGELVGYNCTVKKTEDTLEIRPAEDVVSRVHLNLKNKHKVECIFKNRHRTEGDFVGMRWIGPGGIPEDLR